MGLGAQACKLNRYMPTLLDVVSDKSGSDLSSSDDNGGFSASLRSPRVLAIDMGKMIDRICKSL